jgi:Family of unknown function (DUF6510)
MDPLDGNAIAGLMLDVFGVEMTTAKGTCANCASIAMMAERVVYLPAPGAVVRCRTCDAVMMVIVERRGTYIVDMRGVALLEHP